MKESRRIEGEINIEKLGEKTVKEWLLEKEATQDEKKELASDSLTKKEVQDTKTEGKDLEENEATKEVKKEIKTLLSLAEERGLSYAIDEVQKSDDPFLIDFFHDILAKNKRFEEFFKK